MAAQESKEMVMQRLEKTWADLEVNRLFLLLKDRFEKPEKVFPIRAGKKDIAIPRPFLLVAYTRRTEGGSHFDKASRFEAELVTEIIEKREYALALNNDGFYARFRSNRPQFIERPSRLKRPADLQSLLEANITRERSRRPDPWVLWGGNKPSAS